MPNTNPTGRSRPDSAPSGLGATIAPPQRQCADCEEVIPHDEDTNTTHDGRSICDTCAHDYVCCDDCGELRNVDSMLGVYCPDCSANHQDDYDDGSLRTRDWYSGDSYKDSQNSSSPIQSMRPFGVELELTVGDYARANRISKELPQHVGIHTDGSIRGVGMEVVTPVMNGIKAVNLVHKMCDKMKEHGASVNKSCGYHVHIDMSEINNDSGDKIHRKLRDLWLFYIAFEDVIMSFLPDSRRNNQYCHVLRSDYNFREIHNSSNTGQLERIWYRVSNERELNSRKASHKDTSRYRGINMHTLFAERHIEIRYHSGTINARKILEWANLHLMIADTCFFRGIDTDYLMAMTNEIDMAKKTDMFFQILNIETRSEGYFRARQAHFMKDTKAKEVEKEDTETLAALLVGEAEQ